MEYEKKDYPTEEEMNDMAKIHFAKPKNITIDETIKDFREMVGN